MKISVCIPVYNFDVKKLVFSLKKEIEENTLHAEILLIDDASEKVFVNQNKTLKNSVQNFIFLQENQGRSKVRNLFLQIASGDYLLFLDCDATIISDDFLTNYIQFLKTEDKADVVYGGFIADAETSKHTLRYEYSQKREIQTAATRTLNPHVCFKTVNFIIKKEIFNKNRFDENLTKYGYEDFLFAADLKTSGVLISHIDNPVLHLDNENNAAFVEKVEQGVDTLSFLLKNEKTHEKMLSVKLVKAYYFLKKFGVSQMFLHIFKRKKVTIKKDLVQKKPSLRKLDFYKLGLLLEKMNKK